MAAATYLRTLRAGMARRAPNSSTLALIAGVLLTTGVLTATLWVAISDRAETILSVHEKAELVARMLEDQTTRTVETGFFAMDTLVEFATLPVSSAEKTRTEAFLTQALRGLPFMRSLALVDTNGLVIASSTPGDAGLNIALQKLGYGPQSGQHTVGPLTLGRSIASLSTDNLQRPSPAGLAFIPLLRPFVASDGKPLILVGLLNPDSLANRQQMAVGRIGFQSMIAAYDGKVIATSGMPSMRDADVADLPVFRTYLPAHQHGVFTGQGFGGPEQIVAFRLSKSQPLVILVEESMTSALARWQQDVRGYLYVGFAASALMLLLSLVAWRGLRSREAARHMARQVQVRIAQSERELAVLMRSVQEVIFRTNTAGRITFVNARLALLTGGSESQTIGRTLQELVEPNYRAAVENLFARAEAGGVRTCQAMFHLDGGRQLLFDVAMVPLLENGKLMGYAGSAVDITDRWVAQQKLQNELEFRGLVLEVNPLPISMTDIQGRLMMVNRAWEAYKGRERAQVIGLRLADFLPAEEVAVHESADRQLLGQGGQTMFETRVLHGGRTWRDTRITKALVYDASGQATAILCTLMDVSDFRAAERLTRQAQEAYDEAARSKSEFVANMSHELRTPLQSIMGFSELGMFRSKADARLTDMFEDIHRSGERMLSLVNDLLDVAKLESTVGTFQLERVDLRGVIYPVLRELDPLLAQRKLRLDVALGDLPLSAKVDPLRFQQVIRNVLANAIKFSPQASSIALLGRMDSRGQIRLAVRDHGPGIPEQELGAIFEAFKQSSTTKDGSGGTGLGLAICKKIVEALGGRIYAENVKQGGSVFHIILPARGFSETIPAELQ